MERFYIQWPGSFHAEGPISLFSEGARGTPVTHSSSEEEVIDALLGYLNIDELLEGFGWWPTDD
jgi:hypothetical protein